jgi:hypothetical protein
MLRGPQKVIPTTPKPPASKAVPKAGSTGAGKDAGTSAAASAKAEVRAAENRAIARENANKSKAGKKFLTQAGNLEAQVKSLKEALKSYRTNLNQNLGDVDQVLNQQFDLLKSGHALRSAGLLGTSKDNEIATGSSSEQNFSNLVRERQDALTGILEQGAGETDALRAMVMSARNWSTNQAEASRTYYDTARSINTSIVDLNIDTQTALANMDLQSEADKEKLWADFFNRNSETYTQIGNLKGQQADYYASAREMGVNPGKGVVAGATKVMEDSFMKAAKEMAKSYDNPGLKDWIKNFHGTEPPKASQSNTNLASALIIEPMEKAEGATLRKWDAA